MIFVTSDIHGYPLESFLRLLEKAGFSASDQLYVIGDVIDRNGDGGIAMLLWLAPAALVCLAINLLAFLDERKDPEQRRIIGMRWLWIPVTFLGTLAVKWLYLWLVVAVILWPDRFPV